ncbi:hypothetical protein Tco_0046369 [Tanacetum coccineum]
MGRKRCLEKHTSHCKVKEVEFWVKSAFMHNASASSGSDGPIRLWVIFVSVVKIQRKELEVVPYTIGKDDEPVVLGDSVSKVLHEGSTMLAGSDVTKVIASKIMVTEEGYFSTKVTTTDMHNPTVMATHGHVTRTTYTSGSFNVLTEPTCIYLISNLGGTMTASDTSVVNGSSKSTSHITEVTPSSALLNGASLVGSCSHNVTNTGNEDYDFALTTDMGNINVDKDLLEQILAGFYDVVFTGLNLVDLNSSPEAIKSLEDVLESGPWMIHNSPIILKKRMMNTSLFKEELNRISIFAHCLIEVKADEVLKDNITMGIPLPEGTGFIKKMVRVEYEWKPPRCEQCKILGHAYDECPKNATAIPIVDMNNDGFQTVVNKRKSGKTCSTNNNRSGVTAGKATWQPIKSNPAKAIDIPSSSYTSVTAKKGGPKVSTNLSNIPTSNPYDWLSEKFDLENYTRSEGCPNVLDDMESEDVKNLDLRSREFREAQNSVVDMRYEVGENDGSWIEEEVEVIFDETVNLANSTKTRASTYTTLEESKT